MKFSHLLQLFILLVFASSFACSPNQSAQNWVRKTEHQWSSWEKSQPQWLETLDTTTLQEQLAFLTTAQQKAQNWYFYGPRKAFLFCGMKHHWED
jgi:Spy/CpxP family protein refolding chaperone